MERNQIVQPNGTFYEFLEFLTRSGLNKDDPAELDLAKQEYSEGLNEFCRSRTIQYLKSGKIEISFECPRRGLTPKYLKRQTERVEKQRQRRRAKRIMSNKPRRSWWPAAFGGQKPGSHQDGRHKRR